MTISAANTPGSAGVRLGDGALLADDIAALNEAHKAARAEDIIKVAVQSLFNGRIALVSSFGAEAAVLLHMTAQIEANIPVIFVDTGKLFAETLIYRGELIERFGLTNVLTVQPDEELLEAEDPHGDLWQRDVDACCHIRKVLPFDKIIQNYDAQISGRKRFQNEVRADLNFFELAGAQVKVNPLINWTPDELKTYVSAHDIPPHPLVAKGFASIGCEPCTSPVKEGEDPRAGRWRNEDKTECGIHFVDGKPVRNGA